MILLKEGFVLSELKEVVLAEFGLSGESCKVSFSYGASKPLPLGLKTPPVLLTSDRAISCFFCTFSDNPSMNLFVIFEVEGMKRCVATVKEVPTYKTPVGAHKRRSLYENTEAYKTPNDGC